MKENEVVELRKIEPDRVIIHDIDGGNAAEDGLLGLNQGVDIGLNRLGIEGRAVMEGNALSEFNRLLKN
jgi:putative ubiquitin-RnfH superfamily antitoxin RatB of RatAB toxin-antitoxin module